MHKLQQFQFISLKSTKMRKTSNIMIRQSAKKSRQNPKANTSTSFRSNPSKISSKEPSKRILPLENLQMHKQMIKAENITEQQHQQILKQARKTVSKKMRSTETKIESQLVSTLQYQCAKLGDQLQRQKVNSHKLTIQVQKLRKNIQFLNEKLQRMYNDQSALQKNNLHGKAEKVQLGQQMQQLRTALKRKQDQYQYHMSQNKIKVEQLQNQAIEMKNKIMNLQSNMKNLRQQKDQIEEQLQQKTRQSQYIRQCFEEKKKQWDYHLKNLEAQKHQIVQKKGEKITRFQADSQKMMEKLKQQENMRKKLVSKNQDLEKQVNKQIDSKKQLQQQIVTMKKRVNDLSILKSSNNTIFNQKIAKLTQENQKLKSQVQILKGNKKVQKQEKPFLFGPQDCD